MKKALKIVSTTSIILFGALWLSSKFDFLNQFNSIDIRNLLVLIYLFTSLKYSQIEIKSKIAEIQDLKIELKNIKNKSESV